MAGDNTTLSIQSRGKSVPPDGGYFVWFNRLIRYFSVAYEDEGALHRQ